MFIHKQTWLIITQKEHARFSWVIASFWWNELFQEVPLPRDKYLLWVIEHDRWFWDNDTIVIWKEEVQYTTEERIALIKKWINAHNADPIVDITSLLQIQHLCKFNDYLHPYWEEIDTYIDSLIKKYSLNKETHVQAQTITRLCDNIAYDFCSWRYRSVSMNTVSNFDTWKKLDISYSIQWKNITVRPFPLKEPILWFIIWYEAENYPEKLVSHILEYTIT